MADPGFPVGGRGPVRGGVDLRRGCFLAKMYAKMKEFGPVGGGRYAPGVTVNNIPTQKIIPPVYFHV